MSIRTIVEINEVTVTFERWGQTVCALKDVCLSIPQGQWVMLVGHNGSGKSTLLHAIGGQLRPLRGKIVVAGTSLHGPGQSVVSDGIFHVYQDPLAGTAAKMTLFENLFVADNKIRGQNRRQLAEKYRSLLASVGLADRMHQQVHCLSGGERQLVALLVARLRSPKLLLLDEPLAALDPNRVKQSLDLIVKLHGEGRTVLQVTHDPTLARTAGDRTIVMRDGAIAYDVLGQSRLRSDFGKTWLAPI